MAVNLRRNEPQEPTRTEREFWSGELSITILWCGGAKGFGKKIRDKTLEAICEELNTTETIYPGTNLRLVYRPMRSAVFPRSQDV